MTTTPAMNDENIAFEPEEDFRTIKDRRSKVGTLQPFVRACLSDEIIGRQEASVRVLEDVALIVFSLACSRVSGLLYE